MTSRILHFSDFHISENKYIPLSNFLNVLSQIHMCAIEENCEAIIFSGDFFDKKKNHRHLYDSIIERFLQLDKVTWYLGLGNHDRDNKGHSLEIFNILFSKIPHVRVVDIPSTIKIGKYSIRLIHGIVSGAVLDNGYKVEEKLSDLADVDLEIEPGEQIDYYAFGHLHERQKVKQVPFGYYAGSVFQLNFGDYKKDPGWHIVDLETKKIKKYYNLDHLVLFKPMEIDLDDLDLFKKNFEPETYQTVYKFIITGTHDQIFDFKSRQFKHFLKDCDKCIIESRPLRSKAEKRIEEINQTSTLEEDVTSFVNKIDLSEHDLDRSLLERYVLEYIEKARESE